MFVLPGIRLATLRDARPIAELSRDTIEAGLGWSWTPMRVVRSLREPSTNVAVAHEGDALLGFSIMKFGDEHAHLLLLAVAPHRRGQGLGRHLVQWQEACARVAGVARVELEARADNLRALGFYADLGYHATARVAGYYQGAVDALRLRKDLGS